MEVQPFGVAAAQAFAVAAPPTSISSPPTTSDDRAEPLGHGRIAVGFRHRASAANNATSRPDGPNGVGEQHPTSLANRRAAGRCRLDTWIEPR
jgi:hypothetical protein